MVKFRVKLTTLSNKTTFAWHSLYNVRKTIQTNTTPRVVRIITGIYLSCPSSLSWTNPIFHEVFDVKEEINLSSNRIKRPLVYIHVMNGKRFTLVIFSEYINLEILNLYRRNPSKAEQIYNLIRKVKFQQCVCICTNKGLRLSFCNSF